MNNGTFSNPPWLIDEAFPSPIEKPVPTIADKVIPPRINEPSAQRIDKSIPRPIPKVTLTGKRAKE